VTASEPSTVGCHILDASDAISPEWLTRALGDLTDRIVACDVTRIAHGNALLSDVHRVGLRYATGNGIGPGSVVVKLAASDPDQRFVAELLGLYRREALVYERLVTRLPYRTPTCHLARASADGRETTVVLEDLARCAAVDQLTGAPWPVVLASIEAMAAQHGAWLEQPELNELASVLLRLDDPLYTAALPVVFEQGWAIARDVLGEQIGRRPAAFAQRWCDELPALVARLASPPTLLHGDWRADNLYLDGDTLVVADFQIAGVGSGIYDLAYFAGQSVAPAVRRGRDRELVSRYADALAAHGVLMDHDALWDGYRTALLFCLVYPVAAFRAWPEETARGRQLVETMLLRAADAIEATDALDLVHRSR
jgi:hypothetical protein